MFNTATEEGRAKRMEELVEGYKETKNQAGIVRLIGGSRFDYQDYIPGRDDGEEPYGQDH